MLHPDSSYKKAGYILLLKKIGQIMALKARFCHLPKKPKGSQIKISEKKLHRASYIFIDEKKLT